MGVVEHHSALNRPENPVCSVCIANYNGAAILEDCLDSVLNQAGTFSVEIIVHDDASTDDSLELLRKKYPQVEVLASAQNVGFCISNNRMVAHARGDFVLLLNNDAALESDAVVTLMEASTEQTRIGILTLPQYDWETGLLVDRGCLLDPFYNPVPNLDIQRREVAMVIGACFWILRSIWIESGGFPEWIGSIGEDLYLSCVVRLSGRSVGVTDCSGYRHRQGVSFGGNRATSYGLQTTFRRRYLSERNKTACLLIFTPTIWVWPLLALHLVLLTVEGFFLTIFRGDRRVWREIYGRVLVETWRQLSATRRIRAAVQQHRRLSSSNYWRNFTWLPRKLALLRRYGLPKIE